MADDPHPAEKDLRIPTKPRDPIRAVLKGGGVPHQPNPKAEQSGHIPIDPHYGGE